MAEFADVIETREQLRAILDEPGEIITRKTLSHLDKHCGVFINRAPFLLLSTSDAEGNVDISPKRDPEGFVKIIDEHTLAIPDRLGNYWGSDIQLENLCRDSINAITACR